MLAKLADALPAAGSYLYEPKWDGFRAIVFRGASDVYIQSRDLRPLDRYFPELHESLLARLPEGCVIDGEIVIRTPHGLDFDALQLRLHPASSRVAMLAAAQPASFVAFDVLVEDGRDVAMFRRALAELVRLQEAAGAQEIVTFGRKTPIWTRGEDVEAFTRAVHDAPLEPHEHAVFSAHQMGSCRMGIQPATSVADPWGELHDTKGVWIGDASAFPTASGTNPMITIMALAHRTAERIAAGARTLQEA